MVFLLGAPGQGRGLAQANQELPAGGTGHVRVPRAQPEVQWGCSLRIRLCTLLGFHVPFLLAAAHGTFTGQGLSLQPHWVHVRSTGCTALGSQTHLQDPGLASKQQQCGVGWVRGFLDPGRWDR